MAALCVIGAFFYPIQMIVNNILLGHSKTNDETPLAGLGLGSLTFGLIGSSVATSFAYGVETFMSQEFGRGNLRQIQVYRNRSLFINTVLFLVLLVPTLFIEQIYEAIGQEE